MLDYCSIDVWPACIHSDSCLGDAETSNPSTAAAAADAAPSDVGATAGVNGKAALRQRLEALVTAQPVMLFMKGTHLL